MTDLRENECITFLRNNYLGHLSFISKGGPYVIPITYYYDPANKSIVSYSEKGHKIEAMRKSKLVSLEVEEIISNNNWQSVLVHGTYEELHGSDAKYCLHQFTEGVKNIITLKKHTHPKFISEFSSKSNTRGIPIVYRININEITGKRKET